MKNCVILEMENSNDFENAMNDYLDDGYKVETGCPMNDPYWIISWK